MPLVMDLLVALCVGSGIGALASWWQGRSFGRWALIGSVGALVSAPIAAGAAIIILAILGSNDKGDDDGFSSSDLGGGDD
jgi:hypothetical protein